MMRERDGGELRQQGFARAVDGGLRELVEERVGFAIDDAVALVNRRPADGLRQMICPSLVAREQRILAPADEGGRRQVKDERAIHLLVEIEIEAVERLASISEARQFVATFIEPVLPALQLVADEHGDEIEGRHALRLGVLQACREHIGNA